MPASFKMALLLLPLIMSSSWMTLKSRIRLSFFSSPLPLIYEVDFFLSLGATIDFNCNSKASLSSFKDRIYFLKDYIRTLYKTVSIHKYLNFSFVSTNSPYLNLQSPSSTSCSLLLFVSKSISLFSLKYFSYTFFSLIITSSFSWILNFSDLMSYLRF